MKKEKIGVGIVTYESESYLEALYNTLPLDKIDEIVIVNGGSPYKGKYNANLIQHNGNYYPAMCRNDAVSFLMERDCEHIFIIEDDIMIKNEEVFNKYIETSKLSGIKYLCFTSTSWGSGEPGKRTPKLKVEYSKDTGVALYANSCNEFTYHHKSCFEDVGLYDTQFRDPFDIDLLYRESEADHYPGFWWFPDIIDSDDYVMNNPDAVSRLQAENREDGSRSERIAEQWKMFYNRHHVVVQDIPVKDKESIVKWVKDHKK